jgi:dipeptidyl aminopeptidase/acylaminoacyl peptidase
VLISAEGGKPRTFADGTSPTWAPDGRSIAFVRHSQPSIVAVFIKTLDGDRERRLESTVQKEMKADAMPTVDLSPDGRQLLYTKLAQGTWQIVLIEVAADREVRTLPLNGSATNPHWSLDGQHFTYALQDTGHPASIHVASLDGVQDLRVTKQPAFVKARFVHYNSADGLEIPAFLYLLVKTVAAKRPALVWLHGGFGGATLNEFDPAIQYFVANGFVVLAPNYRTSTGFGPTLADLKSVKSRERIVEDVAASVDYLKTLEAVDSSKLALYGFSFGGWVTMRTLTARPHLFAAAVNLAGMADLRRYYKVLPSTLNSILGGPPNQWAERYHVESPIDFINRLSTPLLVICGKSDPGFSQATELVTALKHAGKDYEFVPYPGEVWVAETPSLN